MLIHVRIEVCFGPQPTDKVLSLELGDSPFLAEAWVEVLHGDADLGLVPSSERAGILEFGFE